MTVISPYLYVQFLFVTFKKECMNLAWFRKVSYDKEWHDDISYRKCLNYVIIVSCLVIMSCHYITMLQMFFI